MPTLTPPESAAAAPAARSAAEIRRWIVNELAGSLKMPAESIDTASPLEALGVDSLAALGMTGGLAGWLGRDLPATLVWDYPSIDSIAEGLANCDDRPEVPPGVIELQESGRGRPIFFLPGLGGHPVTFAALANHLGPEHACYGLTVPGLNGERPLLRTVEEIAAAMLANVRVVQAKGPYQFAGYSFGGLLAYEMAQQLHRAGETVSTLAIYDTFTPAGRVARPLWQRTALHAYCLAARPGRVKYLRERLRIRKASRAAAFEQALRDEVTAADPSRAAIGLDSLTREVARVNKAAAARYQPTPYPGHVALFRATKRPPYDLFYKSDPSHGWAALAGGGVTVIDLPGGHLNLLGTARAPDAARKLARQLALRPSGAQRM